MKRLRFYPLLLTALLQVMPLARVMLTDPLPAAPGASILFKWAVGAFALLGFHAVAGASNLITSATTATGTNGVGFRYRILSSEPRPQDYNATPLPFGLFINGANGTVSNSYILGTPTNFAGTMNVTLSISQAGWPTVTTNLALTIFSRPVITNQPVDRFIASGSNASFSVGAYGSATMVYQWYGVAGGATNPLPNATNAALSITNATASSNYFVIITNTYGRATSSLAALTLVTAPAITSAPTNTTVTAGGTATFTVGANGGNLAYQWRTNGVNLAAATNATLTLTNVPYTYNGRSVDVVVTNSAGSTTSAPPATLSVLFAPVITTPPSGMLRSVGSTGTFSVVALANPAPAYQWRKAGSALPGQTNSTLVFASIQAADAGSYDVVLSNSLGTVTSSSATLTVLFPPSITNSPASRTNTAGTTATFTVGASASPPPSYTWRRNGTNVANGGNISGATTATLTLSNVQLTNAGSFVVIVSNSVGVATSAPPAVLTVHSPPAITAPPANLTVSAGSNAVFTVTATGTPAPGYQWQRNGADLPGETASALTLSNVQPAFNGSSISVVVSNAAGATSAPPALLTVLFAPGITTQPTNLTVNAGSPAAFSVTAEGNPTPACQWRKDGTNLAGQTGTTFNLASAQPADAGSYDVVLTNSQGSVTSVVAVLTVNVTTFPPSITTQPLALARFVGQSATFSVDAAGTGPLYYQWRHGTPGATNNGNLPGETNTALVLTNLTTNHAGNYRVVVTNAAGSTSSVQVALIVAPLPRLKALGLQGGNTLLGLDVSPALPYQLEFATNVTGPWFTLTNLPVQSAATNLTVPDAVTNETRRFYRAISP